MFTCEICFEQRDDRYLMPNQSKGCNCTGKICARCFAQNFFERMKYIQVCDPEPGATNSRGPVTANIDIHWESDEDLLNYIINRFEDSYQGPEEEMDASLETYINQRIKIGKPSVLFLITCPPLNNLAPLV